MLSEDELRREAATTGFRVEVLEKVMRLVELLQALSIHPFLKPRVALKGGTALNIFVFDVPRLSVDIDLNYIGAADRDTMLADRPKVDQAIVAVCGRLGIEVRRAPMDHAGGKWRMSCTTASGRSGTLELDVNFMLRTPLWPHSVLASRPLGSLTAARVPVLDVHELAAGKLAALFGREAGRDLFDVRELLGHGDLDREKLRLGFVVYGGINRRDWRGTSIDDIQADPDGIDRMLVPMLKRGVAPTRDGVEKWTRRLVADCKDLVSSVLPLGNSEREFLDRLNDSGEIVSELLTDDLRLQGVIQAHPGLLWKAHNVKKHRGLGGADGR